MTQSRPVALRLDGHWVWDFWFACDGDKELIRSTRLALDPGSEWWALP